MPRVRPHYAVKANPDRRVLKVLVAGRRRLRDRLDRRARPAARPRRAGGGGLLLQPDEVARVDRLRRGQGRGVVRDRQRRRAAPHPSRSSPTPSCTCASPPPTSAATGRCRASSAPAPADAREIVAGRGEARRRPRRRDLPRRLAVPQPGELARRLEKARSACSTSWPRRASSRACSTSAAATRCATSSRSRRSR